MTIADNLTLLNSTKADIKAAIEAKGVSMTDVPFTDYDTKIGEISGGGIVIPTPSVGTAPYNTWVRNPEWITLPTLIKGVSPEQIVMLFAVYNNSSNGISFQITGAHTIDWGDGNVQNVASNNVVTHVYDYNNAALNGTLTSDGYKQAKITITPQIGSNLTTVFLNRLPFTGQTSGAVVPVLEMIVNAPLCTSIYFVLNSVRYSMMESIKFVDTGILTAFGGFSGCYSLRNIEIGNLDIFKNITTMDLFFSECISLEEIPFFNTNAGAITTLQMFKACASLKHVANIDFSRSTNTSGMYDSCVSLIYVEPTNYSASTNTSNMYYTCSRLETVGNISIPATTTCLNMFANCSNLKLMGDLNLPVCTTVSGMFDQCKELVVIGDVNIPIATNMNNFAQTAWKLKQIGNVNMPSVTTASNAFGGTLISGDLSNFTFGSNLNTVSGMFSGTYITDLTATMPYLGNATNVSSMFSSCYSLETIPDLNLSSATNTFNMFSFCTNLNSDITVTTTTALSNVSNMFYSCYALEVAPTMTVNAATSGNAAGMFTNCYSLSDVDGLEIKGNITNLTGTFQNCSSLEVIATPSKILPEAGTIFSSMFSGCNALTEIGNISFTDGTLSRNFSSLFAGCNSLIYIKMDNVRSNNPTSMFSGCRSLKKIEGTLDIGAVTSISAMFANCHSLKELQIGTSPTSSTLTTSNAFQNNYGLAKMTFSAANTFTITNCFFGSTELNEVYTNLPTVTGKTITVTGNWGTTGDNPAIATAKGWTVTG